MRMTKGELKVWVDLDNVELLKAGGENLSQLVENLFAERAGMHSDKAIDRQIEKRLAEIEQFKRIRAKCARRETVRGEADRNWLVFVTDFEELARKHDFEPRTFSFWYNTMAKEKGFEKRRDELLPIYAKYHPQDAKLHFHYSCEQPIQTEMVEPGAGDTQASIAERPGRSGR